MDMPGSFSRRTLLAGSGASLGAAAFVASNASATTAGLYARLNAIDARTPGGLQVSVHDHRSGRRFTYNAPMRGQCASVVKVLILATACYRAQLLGRTLTATEKAYALPMIQVSDNASATWLWDNVGGAPAVQAMANRLGMYQTVVSTTWGATTTSAADQVLLLDEIAYLGRYLSAASRGYVLGLMGSVTPSQRWGFGMYGISENKNGWLPSPDGWFINSIGRVTGGGRDYTAAVMQTRLTSMAVGTSNATQVAAALYAQLSTPL